MHGPAKMSWVEIIARDAPETNYFKRLIQRFFFNYFFFFFCYWEHKIPGVTYYLKQKRYGEGAKPVVPAAEQFLSGRSLIPLQYIAGSSRSYRCLIASSQYSL